MDVNNVMLNLRHAGSFYLVEDGVVTNKQKTFHMYLHDVVLLIRPPSLVTH